MNLFRAVLTYALMAVALALGIIFAVRGNPWLLIIGLAGFVFIFALFGCLPPRSKHH